MLWRDFSDNRFFYFISRETFWSSNTNSKLGNKKFVDKKEKYGSSGYKVASELSTLSEFTINEYNDLANKYCRIAHKLFIDNLGI